MEPWVQGVMPYYLGPFPNANSALIAEHYAVELRKMVQGGMPYYRGPFPNVNTDKEGFEYFYLFIYLGFRL